MSRILAFVNQKGGVGKSTSVINISAGLAQSSQVQDRNKRVLVVDMDPQANTSQIYSDTSDNDLSIYHLLMKYAHQTDTNSDPISMERLTQPTYLKNVDIIPSNVMLSSAEIDLVNAHGRETILKRIFKDNSDFLNQYDYVLIDCQPSLGLLTINSIISSDHVLVPLKPDVFSLTGLELLTETVSKLQNVFEIDSTILGFFFTQVNTNESMFKESYHLCSKTYGPLLFETAIRKSVSVDHANAMDQTVIDFDLKSNAAQDYLNIANELILKTS